MTFNLYYNRVTLLKGLLLQSFCKTLKYQLIILQQYKTQPSLAVKSPLIKDNLSILDTLRGLAAVYVLIGHARWLLWEGYAEGYQLHPEKYSVANKALMYFFSLFRFGHQAVVFFFVLSGFVIHFSVSKRIDRENDFDIADYLYRRVRRIFPPLVIALLLTYLLDSIGLHHGLSIYFSQTPYSSINQNIKPLLDIQTLFGNLFFVQNVYTPVWGTNGPLWSLTYEWWFYLLYIPLVSVFRKHKNAILFLIIILWILNLYFDVQPLLVKIVFNSFISWFLGMLLADAFLYRSLSIKNVSIFIALVILFNATKNYNFGGADILLSIPITLLLYIALTTRYLDFLKKLRRLGDFSYTLYVIHFPFICLLSGFLLHYNNNHLPQHFYFVIAGILVMLPIAWLVHFISEVPFVKSKKSSE